MATIVSTNRMIRRAYRKRLLPQVEQCLLGRAFPAAAHHSRSTLDRHSASEIMACFDGDTWLSFLSSSDLLIIWKEWVKTKPAHESVSIGNFVQYLYNEQVVHDQELAAINTDPVVTVAGLHEKRVALMATLFVAGYLPKFEPESLLELV
jgi:hypothetical protein